MESAHKEWQSTTHPARLAESLGDGVVRCHLSPRNCTMKPGQHGFCGVRANRDGQLVTLNYGKSVHLTEETIETEAVNHYSPGERILSLGNIGCMLNCVYCHNWKTSQAKFVSDADVYYYTSEQLVDTARRHGIRCLSWTYNDPVVWHEFVRDTARLARDAGLLNLYKSAFYITPEAVDELLPVIDIFSISVKSMDPEYYRRMTTGTLEPVLEATRQVFRAGKHVEVSTLMITDISDNDDTARAVAGWVLRELDETVPVHFVRFHPDYKLRDTIRTPIHRLERARSVARDMGLRYVYLGNVYDTPATNTYCPGCGAELVSRYGLNAQIVGLDDAGACTHCGENAHVTILPSAGPRRPVTAVLDDERIPRRRLQWHGDIRSAHVQLKNMREEPVVVHERRWSANGTRQPWRAIALDPGESFRFIVAKASADEVGFEVAIPEGVQSNLHEVFDRAHFPTLSIEEAPASTDVSPLPLFPGRPASVPLLKTKLTTAAPAACASPTPS